MRSNLVNFMGSMGVESFGLSLIVLVGICVLASWSVVAGVVAVVLFLIGFSVLNWMGNHQKTQLYMKDGALVYTISDLGLNKSTIRYDIEFVNGMNFEKGGVVLHGKIYVTAPFKTKQQVDKCVILEPNKKAVELLEKFYDGY